jgi:SAM-dependent methyltransferase
MAAIRSDAAHWDQVYDQGSSCCSWYQSEPVMSLRMLQLGGARPGDSLIDVGGGASGLVDQLLARGFTDLTVLDVSDTGLGSARRRLGAEAQRVSWLVTDILSWQPERSYRLWHDRAVFHFFVDPTDQQRYLDTLATAVAPGGRIVLATFAADGPPQCSGLPVARYSPDDLADRLGPCFTVLAWEREEHHTPSGVLQPFTWLLAQRPDVTVCDG